MEVPLHKSSLTQKFSNMEVLWPGSSLTWKLFKMEVHYHGNSPDKTQPEHSPTHRLVRNPAFTKTISHVRPSGCKFFILSLGVRESVPFCDPERCQADKTPPNRIASSAAQSKRIVAMPGRRRRRPCTRSACLPRIDAPASPQPPQRLKHLLSLRWDSFVAFSYYRCERKLWKTPGSASSTLHRRTTLVCSWKPAVGNLDKGCLCRGKK